jgi:hypothetical protein
MEFELKLTEQEVNIVLAGLGELPAKHSIELIAKIKQSCESQIKESEDISE